MLSMVGGVKGIVMLFGLMLVVTGAYTFSHYTPVTNSHPIGKVLFDFTKEEDAGNADWRIDGAYSHFANALRGAGFTVDSLGSGHGTITSAELQGYDVLVIPEPQDSFSSSEKNAILNFVSNGGGLIYISDHHGSDRNHNGYSSWDIWNNNLNFDSVFGITLLSKEAGTSGNKITDIQHVPILMDNVSSFGIWAGTTMHVSGNAKAVAYQTIGGSKYAVLAYSTYGNGRVIVYGDSSTFDDGTPDSQNHGDHLYNEWSKYDDSTLAVDMVKWAAGMGSSNGGSSDNTPPVTPTNLNAVAGDKYVKLTWEENTVQNSSWTYATSAPFDGGYGECIVGDSHYIYVLRQRDDNYAPQFYRYDPSSNTWTDLSSSLPNINFQNGVAMAYDYSSSIYVLAGGSYRSNEDRVYFYRYDISSNTWTRLADAPHVEGPGDAIVYSGYDHMVYAFLGRAHYLGSYNPGTYSIFARYDPSTNTWKKLSFPSWWPDGGTDDGASLAWTGGKYIFGLEGEFYENSPLRGFARYDITTDQWVKMADIPTQDGVGDGGSLLWLGHYDSSLSDVIFALDGNGCNETPGYNFSEYHISTNTWTSLPSMPYPVGDYVGNRLAYADGRIYYWQGTPPSWAGGGKRMYYFTPTHGGNVEHFKIYRGTSSRGETYLTEVSGGTFSYTDHSVTNGVTYYYYVTAVSSAGESGKSNEVSATPHANTPTNKILLVDGDGGKDYQTYFTQALNDAGFTYDVWDTSAKGAPSASDLENYKVVIWNVGALWQNILTTDEQNALITYLNNGGKLYLSSQDLLWDLSGGNDGTISNTFVNDYLKVTAVKNDKAYEEVNGVSGDPISGGFSTISLNYPFTNYADEITVGSGASVIFTDSSGAATADRYDSGTFRVVFTAFSFEAVENGNSNTGAALMKNIVNWLLNGGGSSGPSKPSAPLNLQATAGDGYVQLTWNAPTSNGGAAITGYKIYRGTSSGGESYLTTVSGTSYTDKSVSNGVTYYYYVTAVNSAGESGKSNEVSATPQASGVHSNKILFVDDDGGSVYSEYVEEALNDSGLWKNYELYKWDVYKIGYSPTFDDLKDYAGVIWSTGYAYEKTLTSEDQSNLIKYLNNGGRLYLSSQDLLWEINNGNDGAVNNEFVNDYLGVKAVNNDISYTYVHGVSGDPIGGDFGTMYLSYPFDNYADEIGVESGAHAIFYDKYGYATGVRYAHGNYKVVFTAFSFEAVEKYDSNTGAALMHDIISWLLS